MQGHPGSRTEAASTGEGTVVVRNANTEALLEATSSKDAVDYLLLVVGNVNVIRYARRRRGRHLPGESSAIPKKPQHWRKGPKQPPTQSPPPQRRAVQLRAVLRLHMVMLTS